MNENLTKRKADFIQYLDEELAKKPEKWWQQNTNEFIPTRDMGGGKKHDPQNQVETIVKYDFKRALTSSALFLCIIPAFFLITGECRREGFPNGAWGMMVFAAIFLFPPLMRADKKGMLILFNKNGFWTKSMPELIYWHHLVASYIVKEDQGDSTSYYLLLYYYDEAKGEFTKMEYNIDGLDMSKEDIASEFEYWKMLAGTNAITFV